MVKRTVIVGALSGVILGSLVLAGSAFYSIILPRLGMPAIVAPPPPREAIYPITPSRQTSVPRIQPLPGTTVVGLAHDTSGAGLAWALANMGKVTDPGSLMAGHRITMQFHRLEPVSKRIDALRTMAAAFKAAGTAPREAALPGGQEGVHFFTVSGDTSSWVLSDANKALQEVDPGFEAEIVGFVGTSGGEDSLLGPPEWQRQPQNSIGTVVAGIPDDSAWCVLLFWCAQHDIPLNADQGYYDPKALNFVETQTADAAAGMYIDSTPVERVFLSGGEDRRRRPVSQGGKGSIAISGVTTRTPVARRIASERGGLVTIASTRHYPSHAPHFIVGLKQWNQRNPQVVVDMLAALFDASLRIERSHREVKDQRVTPKADTDDRWRASQFLQELLDAGSPEEWYDGYEPAAVQDRRGLAVEIGGARAATLRQNLVFFGLERSGPDRGQAVYSRFAGLADPYDSRSAASAPEWRNAFAETYLEDVYAQYPELAPPDPSQAGTFSRGPLAYTIPFALRLSDLTPEGERVLGEAVGQMRQAGRSRIEIHGYTDSFGSPESNLLLSRQRGERVASWLRERLGAAMPPDVRVIPHGAEDPVVADRVNGEFIPELMTRNRRVVIKIFPQ
ncbi:MAG: OmpA family protein [Acidobacteriota bacterium]